MSPAYAFTIYGNHEEEEYNRSSSPLTSFLFLASLGRDCFMFSAGRAPAGQSSPFYTQPEGIYNIHACAGAAIFFFFFFLGH